MSNHLEMLMQSDSDHRKCRHKGPWELREVSH